MALQGNLNELKRHEMGQYTNTVITGTDATSGDWWAVLCLSETVFATGTVYGGATNPFSATSVAAGTKIPGIWSQIELVSGAVVAFQYTDW